MKIRLTKRPVEAIEPGARDVLVWDTAIPGFGVKVTPKAARIYVLQYSRRGKTRRVTIGRHGDGGLTAEQARGKAESLRGIIRDGGDPAEDRADERKIPTVTILAEEYMASPRFLRLKARTQEGYRRLIDCHILPLLGERRVSEITRSDVDRLMHDVASGKTQLDIKTGKQARRIVRGGKGAANRCLSPLSKMMALAEAETKERKPWRSAGSNPCRGGIEKFDESSGIERARFLSDAQLARLGDALAAAEAADERAKVPANILRLLLLTGARKGEIVGLRREYLDLGRGLARLPDSKTGAKAIVLSAPARQLLAELIGDGNEPGYLFPGPRPARGTAGKPYGGLKGFWAHVREQAKLVDTRIHDLRHSYAAVGASGGSSLLVIGKLLGHSQAATTERYAHLADDPVRQAADTIGNRIAAALGGGKAQVVELSPRFEMSVAGTPFRAAH